jgi:hypothetical protein
VTIRIRDPDPPAFTVRLPEGNVTAMSGEPVDVSATVENAGEATGTGTVALRVDADGNGRLETDETRASRTVTLNAGANTTVAFANASLAGLAARNYTYGVVTGDDAATATVTVGEDGLVAGSVSVEDVTLSPAVIEANSTNDHTLTVDVPNVSDDGNADAFAVTVADGTLESATVSAVDASGTDVSLSGDPDVNATRVSFDVSPNSSATARDLTVTATVTVAAPAVSNATDVAIRIDVSDSSNGRASANATLTVQPADGADSPLDLVGQDGEVSFSEVIGVADSFNGDGTYTQDGTTVDVAFPDVLGVIEAFNTAQ